MALIEAVRAGDVDKVKALLAEGADANELGEAGTTPLIEAAQGGHEGLVRLLLEAGADPSLPDGMGEVPLLKAAANGHRRVASLLFPLASPDQQDMAKAFLGAVGHTEGPEGPGLDRSTLKYKAAVAGARVAKFFGNEDLQKRLDRLDTADKQRKK